MPMLPKLTMISGNNWGQHYYSPLAPCGYMNVVSCIWAWLMRLSLVLTCCAHHRYHSHDPLGFICMHQLRLPYPSPMRAKPKALVLLFFFCVLRIWQYKNLVSPMLHLPRLSQRHLEFRFVACCFKVIASLLNMAYCLRLLHAF